MDANIDKFLSDLSKLEDKVKKKVLRRSLTKAAKVITEDLKTRVNVKTGILKDSIASKVIVRKNKTKAIIGASNSKEDREGKSPTKYMHLSESEGTSKKKGASVTKVKKKLEASMSATQNRVEGILADSLRQGIEDNS